MCLVTGYTMFSVKRLQCFLSQVTVFSVKRLQCFLSQITVFSTRFLSQVTVFHRLKCFSSHRLHVFLVKGYNLTVFNGNTVPVHL